MGRTFRLEFPSECGAKSEMSESDFLPGDMKMFAHLGMYREGVSVLIDVSGRGELCVVSEGILCDRIVIGLFRVDPRVQWESEA